MATTPSPEYAVGWLTLALINAGLAQTKGKSGLCWFLVSLLFGPLATFLLVAIRDRGELGPSERESLIREMQVFMATHLPSTADAADNHRTHSDEGPS